MNNALYRKYRPMTFDGVIGQEHITTTLKNQLQAQRIGHAYLFCGSRGVGKTSMARIFARAINCQNISGAIPCGHCECCDSLKGDSSLDIIEIDAASNNGVDDARDLRERVVYPPINGKYKVYIIDEVHMLTGSAFNALLKTLEEPPPHIVFILATTEPHKLPATILSRCMRFDFRLVSMQEIFSLLTKIYQNEGKEFEDDAIRAIAAAAEGSVRDALSLADMCLMLSQGKLLLKDVSRAIGAGDENSLELLCSIMAGDIKGSLICVNELAIAGKNMNTIAREISNHARDLMVVKSAPSVLEVTRERLGRLEEVAKNYSIAGLAALMQLFNECEQSLKYSLSPRIAMEAAIVRATKLYSLDLNALDQRLLRLERGEGVKINSDSSLEVQTPKVEEPIKSEVKKVEVKSEVRLTPAQLWGRMITYFRKNSSPAYLQIIGRQNPQKVFIKENSLVIYAQRENYLALCDDALLEIARRAILNEGMNLSVRVEKDTGEVDLEREAQSFINEFGRDKVRFSEE